MTENTLHNDINLIERDCGRWDYEFQYGDIVLATGKQSLRNGLIIACLTSWNYLNRKGNTLYETFGNKAYQELNKKKCTIRQYMIQQYFTEVLNNIRRVNRIISLEVKDSKTDPNEYDVYFTVEAINDEIVTGNFPLTTDETLSTSTLNILPNNTSASSIKPITYTITLLTEYGTPLTDEIIYVYVNDEYVGTTTSTDTDGKCTYTQYCTSLLEWEKIRFTWKGNTLYQGTTSNELDFLSVPFHFSKADDHLILTKKEGIPITSWLGKIVETIDDIPTENNTNTYYLIIEDDETVTRYKDKDTLTENDVYGLINKPIIHTGETRLFVENHKNQIYCLEDNHIYGDL